MLEFGRMLTEGREVMEYPLRISRPSTPNPLFPDGIYKIKIYKGIFSMKELADISLSLVYTQGTIYTGGIPSLKVPDLFQDIKDYLPGLYNLIYDYFLHYFGGHVGFVAYFRKVSALGMDRRLHYSLSHRIPKEMRGDNLDPDFVDVMYFSSLDADLPNTIGNLLYYMIKYSCEVVIFENTGQQPLALALSPTGILMPSILDSSRNPFPSVLGYYANREYANLISRSRGKFLPVSLDIPFYSLIFANADPSDPVLGKYSFEYWFSRFLASIGIRFKKISL